MVVVLAVSSSLLFAFIPYYTLFVFVDCCSCLVYWLLLFIVWFIVCFLFSRPLLEDVDDGEVGDGNYFY